MKLRRHTHANGGSLALNEQGRLWFVPDPHVHARVQKRNRRQVPRAFSAFGQHIFCNPTGPTIAPFGGFIGKRDGRALYCWPKFPPWLYTMWWDRDD